MSIEKNLRKWFPGFIRKAFASQGDTSEKGMAEIRIVCKLFNPTGAGTWYLYEKLDEFLYMAFVELGDPRFAEIGTVDIRELAGFIGQFGLPIERDLHFETLHHTLLEVRNKVRCGESL